MKSPNVRGDIPIPTCKNTNRRTAKCRRMCCARPDTRVREDEASGIQTRIDKLGSVQQQLNGWHQPKVKSSSFNPPGPRKS